MINGLEAVIGYAIGTFQIIAIDWWRRVRAHERDLLLIRAELRRLASFEKPFGFDEAGLPRSDFLPRPPEQSELFLKVVGQTDWRLTDEYADDNSQQAAIQLLDGAAMLRHYFAEFQRELASFKALEGAEALKAHRRAAAYAHKYDEVLDEFLYLAHDALRDIERRLALVSLSEQMNRAFGVLPPTHPPLNFSRSDPKFIAWKRARTKDAG